ncbi:hypothetical protein HRbin33_01911 [bacterium HR33]|nr:hypothetical protein HRbin33_01911 [bacterium HR33]
MPATVKFSREFYEKFGHEAVEELVNWLNQIDLGYRTELRELNELNFARFEAKLEGRIAQLEAKLDQRLAQLDAKIDQRAAALEARLIRWTFPFWAPTMLALVGLMIGVLLRI